MNKKIGFIGCGNMGKAMLGGLINKKFIDSKDVFVSTKRKETRDRIVEEFSIQGRESNKEVAKEADVVILAVKPYMFKSVLDEIREVLEGKIVVSIAAGVDIEFLEEELGDKAKIVRTMPNTPALVGEGMSAICPNKNMEKSEIEYISKVFSVFGKCELLEEKDFHGFIALCGSSPAYVFMFIEAMADAGVALGIPRDKAYKLVSQSILGSAKMALDTGKHPGELKDMVCSPGGTTIEAVLEFERSGFRGSVIDGVLKCAEKSKNM